MDDAPTAPAVVVGIDGSTAALSAALWAVDVAVGREAPLRLVSAVDTGGTEGPDDAARRLAAAETALADVVSAVKATDKPVKVDIEIAPGRPAAALVHASRSAALVCVGVVGSHHFQPDRVGSTAATLAVSAHCAVAIVRDASVARRHGRWVLVEADESPDNGVVLQAAVEHARLRNAPLRVIGCWQPAVDDQRATLAGDRQIRARLERQLAPWLRRYPDLQVEQAVVHGSFLEYLRRNAAAVQLLIVGARNPDHVREVVGPAGNAALGDSGCTVLVVNRQHL